jgi:hypothetical protein
MAEMFKSAHCRAAWPLVPAGVGLTTLQSFRRDIGLSHHRLDVGGRCDLASDQMIAAARDRKAVYRAPWRWMIKRFSRMP